MNAIIALTLACLAQAQPYQTTFYNNQGLSFGIGSWNMSLLNWWVSPGIIAGFAVFFFIMLIFLFATCQLLGVQTPAYFVDKSIDFGKSEEVE